MAAAATGNWSYAVPLDEHTGFAPEPRRNTTTSRDSTASGYRELRSSSQRRPSNNFSVPQATAGADPYNIVSDSEAAGSRRASIRASHAAAGRKRSRNTLREKKEDRRAPAVDDSAWIHRDKLAEIEIKEMEEAGIHVRQSRRSSSAGPNGTTASRRSRSQSRSRRPASNEQPNEPVPDELDGPLYASFDDYQRKRVSTIPAADEEEQDFDPNVDSELRTPEEVAAEHQHYKQHMIRPSTSRIPVSKASPVPVPPQVVERDSPLPRSRDGNGALNGSWDDMQYARRARSGSVGSQVLLDEAEGTGTSASRPGSSQLRSSDENSSPRKARLPNNGTLTGRKTSTNAKSSARPTSSSGHKSRPSTSHAPEGEAPWIASMYKPDPRLPPDQQMLPTHAKRMMQEQWEKDGTTGTAYDREFNLLNDKQFQQPPASKIPKPLDVDRAQALLQPNANSGDRNSTSGASRSSGKPSPAGSANRPWPLSPTKSPTRSESSARPGTSGGYKITPTIEQPPRIQRNSAHSSVRGPRPDATPHNPTPRVPDLDEKAVPEEAEKKKGGCGCCIVM